ncbi:hypothetical protein OH76DRAFT_819492 [Lentinus brumalis]|uniref:Uncharacterized protein n=1 Tax=Lentinus brumalis TaxID=2498619 RepID=A0A371D2R2_9APHY|nr:hypothetical protein OH76DRAFT_819492 [Polyporus brumalis]
MVDGEGCEVAEPCPCTARWRSSYVYSPRVGSSDAPQRHSATCCAGSLPTSSRRPGRVPLVEDAYADHVGERAQHPRGPSDRFAADPTIRQPNGPVRLSRFPAGDAPPLRVPFLELRVWGVVSTLTGRWCDVRIHTLVVVRGKRDDTSSPSLGDRLRCEGSSHYVLGILRPGSVLFLGLSASH